MRLTVRVLNSLIYFNGIFTGLNASDLRLPPEFHENAEVEWDLARPGIIRNPNALLSFNKDGHLILPAGRIVPLPPQFLACFALPTYRRGTRVFFYPSWRRIYLVRGQRGPAVRILDIFKTEGGGYVFSPTNYSACSELENALPELRNVPNSTWARLLVSDKPFNGSRTLRVQTNGFNLRINNVNRRTYTRGAINPDLTTDLLSPKLFKVPPRKAGAPTVERFIKLVTTDEETFRALNFRTAEKAVRKVSKVIKDDSPPTLTPAQKAAATRRRNRELARSRGQY